VKNYHRIYQKKGKKKFPAISFYNLVTKKNIRILAPLRGLRIGFTVGILIPAHVRQKGDSEGAICSH